MMTVRDHAKLQIDTLPEQAIVKVIEFINFQKYQFGLLEDEDDEETAYLLSIPGMLEKIEAASQELVSEGCSTEELWDDV